MASRHCPREAEVIRLAWEAGSSAFPPELAAHLAECPGCAEIATLAAGLRDHREAACAAARPPSAGAVWWRAQRRAREEAARRAASPITLVHGIALGCAAAAALAILGLGAVRSYLGALLHLGSWHSLPAPSAAVHALASLPVSALLMLGAALLLAPVAIFLAVSEK